MAAAKTAERVVATCFIVAMLAGIAFLAFYIGFGVHTLDAVMRSNLALGTSMAIAFLGLAFGATIWVRSLMPDVELTEARKPLASSAEDRAAFAKTFRRWRRGQPVRQAADAAAYPDRGHAADRGGTRSCCSATWARCPAPACGTRSGKGAPG